MRRKPRRALNAEQMAYRQRADAFLASREAGWTLTRDALLQGVSVPALIAAASDAASFADEALRIVEQEYQPAVACREGCSYCCCKPGVLVSIVELLRILGHVRATFTPEQAAELKERAARYAAVLRGRHFNDLVSGAVPCPLLVNGRCSVYEVRPLVCRGFNSMSVDACRDAHGHGERLIPMFAMLKDVTDGTTVGVAQHLNTAGFNDAVVDLGSALHIALEAGDGIAESIAQGGRALEAAEDPSWVGELWARLCDIAREVGLDVDAGAASARRA